MSGILISFIEQVMRPEQELSFGRNADLTLDSANAYLHRRAGRFNRIGDIWWIENLGSRLRLKIVSAEGSVIDLRAGASVVAPGSGGTVSLHAGPTRYEIGYELEGAAHSHGNPHLTVEGIETVTYGASLTPRELDFVVVLAKGRLTGRGGPLPSHTEIAGIWNVSAKTVDNTLQRLRAKLRATGVRQLDSTEALVEHLVSQGFVSLADLEWAQLDTPTPRSKTDAPQA